MIDGLLISGAEATEDGVRVLVGPILLSLATTPRDSELIGAAGSGRIHCHLEIDDGRPLLIGFLEEADRELYRAMREVSGVGPRTALAVLGAGRARDLLRAVAAGEDAHLTRAPGVGSARARKIISHLSARYGGRLPAPVPAPVGAWVVAREGLVSGGIDEDRAEALLARAAAAGHRSAEALLGSALELTEGP